MIDAVDTIDNEHPALAGFWHPVASVDEVGDGPVAVTLLGRRWVVVRLGGSLTALPDRCPHRFAPLSAGVVDGDLLRCAYHGYAFDRDGSLLVLEIAKNSLASGDPAGALIRLRPDGSRETLLEDGLISPTAVAVGRDGWIYLSNHGQEAGVGEVVRFRDCPR